MNVCSLHLKFIKNFCVLDDKKLKETMIKELTECKNPNIDEDNVLTLTQDNGNKIVYTPFGSFMKRTILHESVLFNEDGYREKEKYSI